MEEIETEKVTTVSHGTPSHVTETTKTVSGPPIKTEHPQKVYEKKKTIFRTYQVIWYILGLIEVLLTFRVVLKILGANISSGFVNLIYIITDPLALPFKGIFRVTYIDTGAYLEWSTLVGMVVYLLVAFGLIQLMQLIKPTNPQEVDEKVENA
jgi:hypothetical protein